MKKVLVIVATILLLSSNVLALTQIMHLQPGDDVVVDCAEPFENVDLQSNTFSADCPVPPAPSEPVDPYPDAPQCVVHPAGYHGLWNYDDGCHYTHTHGDDIEEIEDFFGTTYAELYGQEIGFPWSPEIENQGFLHNGYRFYSNLYPQPAYSQETYSYKADREGYDYITAFAIEVHDANGVARLHSGSLWVKTESRDGIEGWAYISGLQDSGCAHIPYKQDIVQMPEFDPVDTNGQSLCVEGDFKLPYRGMATQQQAEGAAKYDKRNKWIWDFEQKYGYNQLGFFHMRTFDSFGWVDPNNYMVRHNVCDSAVGCRYVNTDMQVFNVVLDVPEFLDLDDDGYVTYSGFADLQGNIDISCTSISPECVPVIFNNVPVGYSNWSRAGSQVFEPSLTHEWNIFFDGVPSGWVELPPVQ